MHGGHADVAMRLGWKMMSKSRKPPGYWDSLPNVLREVTAFCEDQVRCACACAFCKCVPHPLRMWRVQPAHMHAWCTRSGHSGSASVIIILGSLCHSPWCAETRASMHPFETQLQGSLLFAVRLRVEGFRCRACRRT